MKTLPKRRNVRCILILLWVFGGLLCVFLGLGIRLTVFGWHRNRYQPGEEVLLMTGKKQGLFCERILLQSSSPITAKTIRVYDWKQLRNPQSNIDHIDASLVDKYYDFRKYRLYAKESLDIRVCSEKGMFLYLVTSHELFLQLKFDLERGVPCPANPRENDPVCGKSILTYCIPPAKIPCRWLITGEDIDEAVIHKGWQRIPFLATAPTDLYIVLSSSNMVNNGKNLMEVVSHKLTYLAGRVNVLTECVQQDQCLFTLDFAFDQALILRVGNSNQEVAELVEVASFCKARDWFFVLLFCIIPIILLSGISFFIARKYGSHHYLVVEQ
ncbi:hypothetical protein RvY_11701 [Ramazzottius varieornatus]|uniref:E3 ubiquitin-protein ligase APD1-4 middle domain-containing protein n=1 Tax=Ramazzottius varieornatus TaxID=947166 RepID=A0A1D1VQT3_RAMVA|nr:hypothetical protein RvY_11701 [Ramazzottius varieornatus]